MPPGWAWRSLTSHWYSLSPGRKWASASTWYILQLVAPAVYGQAEPAAVPTFASVQDPSRT